MALTEGRRRELPPYVIMTKTGWRPLLPPMQPAPPPKDGWTFPGARAWDALMGRKALAEHREATR